MFRDSNAFVERLGVKLAGGLKAHAFFAAGRNERGGNTLTVSYVAAAVR